MKRNNYLLKSVFQAPHASRFYLKSFISNKICFLTSLALMELSEQNISHAPFYIFKSVGLQ